MNKIKTLREAALELEYSTGGLSYLIDKLRAIADEWDKAEPVAYKFINTENGNDCAMLSEDSEARPFIAGHFKMVEVTPLYETPQYDAELLELLNGALIRMDRARAILTNNRPSPHNNWGMLDTSDIRTAIAARSEK